MHTPRTPLRISTHVFEPVFDEHAKVLLLGSIPSPKSKENGFYYTHPQNRFWKTIAAIFHEKLPQTNEERRQLVLKHGIALWDVLHSCEIRGASDASIQNPVANDLEIILSQATIKAIFTTGKKATLLYEKLIEPKIHRPCIYLPSTSPANRANADDDALIQAYGQIKHYLT